MVLVDSSKHLRTSGGLLQLSFKQHQVDSLKAQVQEQDINKKQMNDAANEETDHLAWCEERLTELSSKPSILNPIWYTGSILLGALAGLAGDKVSLGFVAETERQVSAHLHRHLLNLPQQDKKSEAILVHMQKDEEQHATAAAEAGAIELPYIVKQLMSAVSKLMTKSSYYV